MLTAWIAEGKPSAIRSKYSLQSRREEINLVGFDDCREQCPETCTALRARWDQTRRAAGGYPRRESAEPRRPGTQGGGSLGCGLGLPQHNPSGDGRDSYGRGAGEE